METKKYTIDISAERGRPRSCFTLQTSVTGLASNAFFLTAQKRMDYLE